MRLGTSGETQGKCKWRVRAPSSPELPVRTLAVSQQCVVEPGNALSRYPLLLLPPPPGVLHYTRLSQIIISSRPMWPHVDVGPSLRRDPRQGRGAEGRGRRECWPGVAAGGRAAKSGPTGPPRAPLPHAETRAAVEIGCMAVGGAVLYTVHYSFPPQFPPPRPPTSCIPEQLPWP